MVELVDKFDIGSLPNSDRKFRTNEAEERCIATVTDFAVALNLGRACNSTESSCHCGRNRQITNDEALMAKSRSSPKFAGRIIVLAKSYGRAGDPTKNETSAYIDEIATVCGPDYIVVSVVGTKDVDRIPEGPARKDATKNVEIILRRHTVRERILGREIDKGRIVIGVSRTD
jgi:hypothetical protein